MERISFNDVKGHLNGVTEVYDIMNAIRNSASTQFQDYVPLANADNVTQVGHALMNHKQLQNEFITSLVERIGKVIIRKVSLSNPLGKFKSENMEYGRTIEEIFIDIAEEHLYDPEVAETEVFKREIPNVKTLFHEVNREGFFKQTIQDGNLKRAFVSWDGFGDFVSGIVTAMYNSDEVHEYRYMMLAVDNFYSKGLIRTEKVNPVLDNQSGKDFVKAVRKAVRKMTMPSGSRAYNSMAVHTRANLDRLHLLITADLEAEIDVELLASAFNMDKTNFLGKVTIVDEFASPGLEAVLVDESFFVFHDVLFSMETQRNSQGLYWNYFLHHQQMISTSRFAPSVAFVTNEDVAPITNIIVNPGLVSVMAGKDAKFNAYIRQTDDVKYELTWNVETVGTTTKRQATAIDASGNLHVAENQEGQLRVTASASYTVGEDTEAVTTTVVGESFVNVRPAKGN